jgi:hypothetical protein
MVFFIALSHVLQHLGHDPEKKKPLSSAKTVTLSSKLLRSAKEEKAVDREQREKGLLAIANLITMRGDPSDFPAKEGWDETPDERAAFEQFLNLHFPRRKFGALRDELDIASRSKVTSPIRLYRSIFETRQRLRSAVRTMNFISEQLGIRRHPLQICEEGCGRLFLATRPDKLTCSDRCSGRRRVARGRVKERLHEDIQKSMAAAGSETVARALAFGSKKRGARR